MIGVFNESQYVTGNCYMENGYLFPPEEGLK